jgi:hypothetical protein
MGPTLRCWTLSRAWPTCRTRRPTAPLLMIVAAQAELAERRPAPGRPPACRRHAIRHEPLPDAETAPYCRPSSNIRA